MWPLWSRTFITPGSRWQGRSVLWHYKKNTGRKCQWDDQKKKKKQHRPNDLHLPWPVSKHSVVQLSHHQVLFPQHNKVRTLWSQWQQQKKTPTVLRENNDLAKHTKNKGNFQVTPMKPFLGGGKTSRFVSVLFSGPPCPWNKKTFMRNMDNYHCGQAYSPQVRSLKSAHAFKCSIWTTATLWIFDDGSLIRGSWCSSNCECDLWPIRVYESLLKTAVCSPCRNWLPGSPWGRRGQEVPRESSQPKGQGWADLLLCILLKVLPWSRIWVSCSFSVFY